MEELFKQYGGVIVTVVVILALVAIISILLATGATPGIVTNAFNTLVTTLSGKAK